jgi:hypothetical protein
MNRTETIIVTQIITRALVKGYMITIDTDGEDYDLVNSTCEQEIFETVFACDYARVTFRDAQFKRLGFIMFMYGNGEEVVCDYSDNPEMEALVNP